MDAGLRKHDLETERALFDRAHHVRIARWLAQTAFVILILLFGARWSYVPRGALVSMASRRLAMLGITSGVGACWLMLRRRDAGYTAVHLFLGFALLCINVSADRIGGLCSPALGWQPVLIAVAALTLPLRSAAPWAIISALCFYVHAARVDPHEWPRHVGTPFGYALARALSCLATWWCVYRFELARLASTRALHAASAAVRDIVDNVAAGFFVIDRDLVVQPQCTRSCEALFGAAAVAGQPMLALLPEMSADERAMFRLQIEQVFEDVMPPDMILSAQTQRRFPIRGRVLHIEGRALRGAGDQIKGILFTVTDHTELEASQRESRHQRVLIDLLRGRAAFRGFLREADAELRGAAQAIAAGDQAAGRRELHTLKGAAGCFGLTDLMTLIHHVEDEPRLQPEHVEAVRAGLSRFLAENYEVLGLRLGEAGSPADGERPVRMLLGPLAELAARIAAQQGKQVRFSLLGGETPADAEELGGVLQSLPHLIRNAIDHGIEVPPERGAKPAAGTLQLSIQRDAAAYRIELRDDGRGIDGERLVQRALALGLLDAQSASRLSAEERVALIFRDGLSTAAQVTELSGRGAGMAAVRAAVVARGGGVDIESRLGLGTCFVLRVPRQAPLADLNKGLRS